MPRICTSFSANKLLVHYAKVSDSIAKVLLLFSSAGMRGVLEHVSFIPARYFYAYSVQWKVLYFVRIFLQFISDILSRIALCNVLYV